MKIIYVFLCVLLLMLFVPSISASTFPVSIMYNSVILSVNNDEICGGVFRTPDTVITASHCLSDNPPLHILVYDVGGNKIPARPIFVSITRDLALIQLDHASPIAARVAQPTLAAHYALGDGIWVVGAPNSEPFVVLHGHIAKITHDNYSNCSRGDLTGVTVQEQVFIDARVYDGDSGGGVFDTNGNLIGISQRLAVGGGSTNCTPPSPFSQPPVITMLWGLAAGTLAIQEFLTEANLTW